MKTVDEIYKKITFWQNAFLFAMAAFAVVLAFLLFIMLDRSVLARANEALAEQYVQLTTALELSCVASVPGQLVWHTLADNGESRCIEFRQPISRDKMAKGV